MLFHIHTFGCRVNYAESEQLSLAMQKNGFVESVPEKSDLVIINSCAVTAKAVKEARQLVNHLKAINPGVKIIATGCAATLWSKQKESLGGLDSLIENQNKDYLAALIKKRFTHEQANSLKPVFSKFLESSRLMVKVQDGCDYFCTYCIVPYLRGRATSIKPQQVLKYIQTTQAEHLVNEVVLTGINLGLYQDEFNQGLTGLTQYLLKETSIPKFSFGSLYVENITPEFLALYSGESNSRLTRYFHVPIQSGSQKMLSHMKRRYTLEEFDAKVQALAKAVPDALLATDVIVGFLDESDQDFEDSYSYLQSSPFNKAHIFTYSQREFTAGFYLAKRLNEPSPAVKKARSKRLHALFAKKLAQFQEKLVGQTLNALIIKEYPDYYLGFLDNGLEVKLAKEKKLAREFVSVTIEKIDKTNLIAKLAA